MLKFEFEDCGVSNAFYYPLAKNITICNEMFFSILKDLIIEDHVNYVKRLYNTILFIFLHELGHAIVDICKIPVVGREEDAVDAFAALIATHSYPEIAYDGALYFYKLGVEEQYQSIFAFWDEHSLGFQRFYSILCWLYESDPSKYFLLPRIIPEIKNRNCQLEYNKLKESWKELMLHKCNINLE